MAILKKAALTFCLLMTIFAVLSNSAAASQDQPSHSFFDSFVSFFSEFFAELSTTGAVVQADTAPPAISSISHSPANPTTGQAVTITVSASDDVQLTKLPIYVDGVAAGGCYDINAASKTCAYTTPVYSTTGTHNYYATAVDTSGNYKTSPTQSFTVAPVPETTPPTIFTMHISPEHPVIGQDITINATASDNAQVSTITLYFGPSNSISESNFVQ